MSGERLISDDTWAILTIFQEAEGEAFAGKLAVAEVIRNRTEKRYASDGTVAGTCLRGAQFSGWNTMAANRLRSACLTTANPQYGDCLRAWSVAQHGSQTVKGALLYYNPSLLVWTPRWADAEHAVPVAVIGAHHFFIPR